MAAVAPRFGLPNAAELYRARYTPTAPGFTAVSTPHKAEQVLEELNQEPGRKTAHNEIASLWAQYSNTHQPSNSRFSPQPATADNLPTSFKTLKLPSHKALAARLADAAARQQRQQQQRRNANVWTTHLAADIAAVCDELGLPVATAKVLATAALKGQISANPGVLLSQLVRLLPLEQHLWGPGSLAHILASLPILVHYDPDTLISNLTVVQQTLGRSKTVAVVRRYPQLLTCSPFRLQSNINKLHNMLGFSNAAAVAAVCVRQPLLLLSSPDSLQQRWQQLRQLMPAVADDLLSKQLRRSPELLLLRTSTVAGKMRCLQQLFEGYDPSTAAAAGGAEGRSRGKKAAPVECSTEAAAVAAVNPQFVPADYGDDFIPWEFEEQPALQLPQLDYVLQHDVAVRLAQLKAATAQLQQRQQQLEQHPKYRQQEQQLGGHHVQLLQRQGSTTCYSSSSSSSNSCDSRVQHLVLKLPALLALSPEMLQNHVTELQLLLGLQPDDKQLQRIVLLQPGLLTQSPATLANKLQLLQYLTGRSEAAVQEMVLRCPAVLTLSIANITNKWAVLQKCMGACSVWQQQLKDAANVTVALMLCYSVHRLQRLEYVVQLCQQNSAANSSSTISNICSSSRAAPAAADVGQMQRQALATVPWRSLVQDSEQAFSNRYPGYRASLQQHEQ